MAETHDFGPWIQTYTGKKYFFLEDNPENIDIEDIGIALSRLPRWAGHTNQFMSVAQHSHMVAGGVFGQTGSKKLALLGLIHDAPEAYMCDLPSPVKRLIPGFKEMENKVWRNISVKLVGEDIPLPEVVHHWDKVVMATEGRDLWPKNSYHSEWMEEFPDPLPWKITPFKPEYAYQVFMTHYEELASV